MSEVIIYSSTGCPHCHDVKEQLQKWNVAYEERNVSEVREYYEELRAKKIFGTPATYINGKVVLGFNPDKLKKRLDAAGIAYQEDSPQGEATPNQDAGKQANGSTASNQTKERGANEAGSAKQAAGQEDGSIFTAVNQDVLDQVYDFVSIGGGPAGASAAVYAARAKLKTLVIDKAPDSGTLAITHKIANYPGIRKEVTGAELLNDMQLHAHDFGAQFVQANVLSVDFSDPEVKKLEVPEGIIKAKSVFIGVGAKAPASKIKGEEEFTGRGVSYCSTCDAAFFEDRIVVVTGDHAEAVHEAEALSKFCKEVRLLIPTGQVKGVDDLSYLEQKENVTIYKKHRVREIHGDHAVEKVVIQDDQRKQQEWEIDGVFLYLSGLKPGTDFLKDQVARDAEGYIVVDDQLKTSVPGVFAGGDARKTPIKQAVLSAADGCVAALAAEQFVNKRAKLRPQYS